MYDKIEDKVIIGFPSVNPEQLNQISTEFAKYSQIATAKFIAGNHNCMLITFTEGNNFTVYAEMLKVISQIYNVERCYFKPKTVFAEILNSVKEGSEFVVK